MLTVSRFAVFAASFAGAWAATATAAIPNPTQCATVTPGGQARHAYWCAHNAAVTAVRIRMAADRHVARWYAPTYCDQNTSILNWNCSTITAGHQTKLTVRFRALPSGWTQTVRVVAP